MRPVIGLYGYFAGTEQFCRCPRISQWMRWLVAGCCLSSGIEGHHRLGASVFSWVWWLVVGCHLRIGVSYGGGSGLGVRVRRYADYRLCLCVLVDVDLPAFHLPFFSFSRPPSFFSFLSPFLLPILKCVVSCFLFVFLPQCLEDVVLVVLVS